MYKKGIVIQEDVLNRLRKFQEELTRKRGKPVSLDEVITYLMDSVEKEHGKPFIPAQKPVKPEKEGLAVSRPQKQVEISAEVSMAEAMQRVADLLGERIRDSCRKYDSRRGICMWYELYDIPGDFRNTFPDLFIDIDGRTRFHVGDHPWICVMCRKGRM